MYGRYEDNTTDAEGGFLVKTEDDEDPDMPTGLDREVPTPEVNENYVNALVMLPIGNRYARGKVVELKIDANGNAIGRGNDNPILDIREYRVGFDDWEVRELAENVITDSIYAACDDSGNEYLIMKSIVDYRKSNGDISVSSQKVVNRGQS